MDSSGSDRIGSFPSWIGLAGQQRESYVCVVRRACDCLAYPAVHFYRHDYTTRKPSWRQPKRALTFFAAVVVPAHMSRTPLTTSSLSI